MEMKKKSQFTCNAGMHCALRAWPGDANQDSSKKEDKIFFWFVPGTRSVSLI